MYDYRLKMNSKADAEALAASWGIEWDGKASHLTAFVPTPEGETNRIDVVILGDLPAQNADGSIQITIQTIEGEQVEVPVMTGKYHVDIRTTHRIIDPQANTFEITPAHPLHKFL